MRIFLCLKTAEIDMGVNFGSGRTILDIKTHFILKLDPSPGGEKPKLMTSSVLLREYL